MPSPVNKKFPLRLFAMLLAGDYLSFSLLSLLPNIGEGVARWSLTARVERGPSEAARSTNKKDCRVTPSPPLTLVLPPPYNVSSYG